MPVTYPVASVACNPIATPHAVPTQSVGNRLGQLDSLASASVIVRLGRNDDIFQQGEITEYCYQIVAGCVRTALLMEDGRRQIGEFLFPGDIVGLADPGEQSFGASAVTPVTLRRFRRATIEAFATRDPAFAQALRHYLTSQIRAARMRVVLLGRGTAGERLASFLREMRERLADSDNDTFKLPMKLGDIADYLGLALETVSRGMTDLRRAGMVATQPARSPAQTRVLH